MRSGRLGVIAGTAIAAMAIIAMAAIGATQAIAEHGTSHTGPGIHQLLDGALPAQDGVILTE